MFQPKILIVDDDDNNRAVLCDTLDGEPYTLLEAVNGNDALKMLEMTTPDLILLDVVMAGMDGVTLLRKLKAQEKTRHIPVIMVTVLNQESQVSICLDEGATDHIAKPFSNLVVRARVRAALREHLSNSDMRLRSETPGKTLGFLGTKGGVGVTTVAVNIALALVQRKHSVILAEMTTFFGGIAQQLGLDNRINYGDLLECKDVDKINRIYLSKCLTRHKTGLKLLFAPQNPHEPREITPQHAEHIIKELAGMAEYTVVDFSGQSSMTSCMAVRHCDYVVVAIEPEEACVARAQAMLSLLQSWGISGESIGAVIVKQSPDAVYMKMSPLQSSLNCKIIGMIPPDPDACMSAARNASPAVISQPTSNFAEAILELATRLAEDQVPAMVF
jgi:pilus assembly protein CpaE